MSSIEPLMSFHMLKPPNGEASGALGSLEDFPAAGWMSRFLKRSIDIAFSISISAIVLPIMLIIACLIKASTPRLSVFFKQKRHGLDGKIIVIYKFRTMTVSEDDQDVLQVTRNDNRITPLGAWLRRTSLDELPQFINVLKGDMSVVGPRPHAVTHNEYYSKLIPGYMLRHSMKPGITGLAQVKGWRGETDTLDKMVGRVRCDLEYIQNWSLLLDLKIIFYTILEVMGANAY